MAPDQFGEGLFGPAFHVFLQQFGVIHVGFFSY
jgi:hypothetical protein